MGTTIRTERGDAVTIAAGPLRRPSGEHLLRLEVHVAQGVAAYLLPHEVEQIATELLRRLNVELVIEMRGPDGRWLAIQPQTFDLGVTFETELVNPPVRVTARARGGVPPSR